MDIFIFKHEYFGTFRKVPSPDDLLFPLQSFVFILSDEQTLLLKNYPDLLKKEYQNQADASTIGNLLFKILQSLDRLKSKEWQSRY